MKSIAKLYKKIPSWVTSIIVMLIIAYVSLDPNPMDINSIKLFKGADKVVHFIMYFTLCSAFIFDYAKSRMPHHTKFSSEAAFTTFAFLYGLIMEILQAKLSEFRVFDAARGLFVNAHCDVLDITANTVGALAALIIIKLWLMHIFRKAMVPLYVSRRHHRHHSHTPSN